MKHKYEETTFRKSSLDRISQINEIIMDYQTQGYDLSLRQLYYQLVAGGHIENSEKSYKAIGNLVNDGRMAGLIDWDAIKDRTRQVHNKNGIYHGPYVVDIANAVRQEIDSCFYSSKWAGQGYYVEAWVEKDALSEVVAGAAEEMDIPYFAARGYSSVSALNEAAGRFARENANGKDCVIVYLGDHDPSGLDMTRDIRERMDKFGVVVDVQRIALNLDQIQAYNPPPNPAKETDKRYADYIKRYGSGSWELDALKPQTLRDLIVNAVSTYFDDEIRTTNLKEMERYKHEQWEKYSKILSLVNEQTI